MINTNIFEKHINTSMLFKRLEFLEILVVKNYFHVTHKKQVTKGIY